MFNELEETTEEILRNLVMELMSQKISKKAFSILTEYLQCIGEMELLAEISVLRRKDLLKKNKISDWHQPE
tara:strand:+ start:16 stop:228 length:213 start_codon:yes stop_codon:yes gene_type:complete